MTDDLRVLDDLERRFIATYYGGGVRQPALRGWLPSGAALAAVLAVLAVAALAVLSGTVAPSAAETALERAANASGRTQSVVLTRGDAWYAQMLETWAVPTPVPPRAGLPPQVSALPTVNVEIQQVRDVWLTRDGAMRERTLVATSFINSLDAARYGRPLPRPSVTTATVQGHGRLASPLFPTLPLFSYRELQDLPVQVSGLRRIVSGLVIKAKAAASRPATARSSPPPHPQSQNARKSNIVTLQGTATPVASCCGSTRVARHAVGDLNVIAWLLAMPVPPGVRAGLYRTAASLPGVRYDGRARDALGREGVEVSVGRGGAQMSVIFDERTGALLATTVAFGQLASKDAFGPLIQTLRTSVIRS